MLVGHVFVRFTETWMYLSTDFPHTVSHLSLSSLSMSSSFWLSSCKEVLSFKARPVRLVVSYTECLLPRAFWNSYNPSNTRKTEVYGQLRSSKCSSRSWVPQPVRLYGKPDVIKPCHLFLCLTHQNMWDTAELLITSHNPPLPLISCCKTTQV